MTTTDDTVVRRQIVVDAPIEGSATVGQQHLQLVRAFDHVIVGENVALRGYNHAGPEAFLHAAPLVKDGGNRVGDFLGAGGGHDALAWSKTRPRNQSSERSATVAIACSAVTG